MKHFGQLTTTEKLQLLTLYWDCERHRHLATEVIPLADPDWRHAAVEYRLCQDCAVQMRAIVEPPL